ncbi:MAG: bifunctional diaminohydroxyphosphoribosylaminopyrimidine deaminase/5-amino-6-(5-phosphoribosylamino)uracil reductase RibD [Bacteroidota bacterium]|nr:bifunctional diaminohydroxyphosphoribosylaminopyrimidine deaminase/5-amino-6-(5-phosphoribosylamino)uracil reductase RibD [Bacteroidota bacterium]
MKKNNYEHIEYMQECLSLAQKGLGSVSPNPMVGAVVVKNRKIVGRGYHKKFGKAHAEVNALEQAGDEAKGSTLYVNLEPCSFYGKTPPCTDLIISKGVKRVVVAMRDPNLQVNGKGISKLKKVKIDVVENVLSKEAAQLNESFVQYITKKLPFVTVKIAQTLDGKISDYRGDSKWITNLESRKETHRLRATHDAILVGANTIKADNPELTVRLVKGKSPIRIVIDGKISSPNNSKIFLTAKTVRTIVFVAESSFKRSCKKVKSLQELGVEIYPIKTQNNHIPLLQILKLIAKLNIASVLIEGGANIFSQFIQNKLADKVVIFIAPKIVGNGKDAVVIKNNRSLKSAISLTNVSYRKLGGDMMVEGYLK